MHACFRTPPSLAFSRTHSPIRTFKFYCNVLHFTAFADEGNILPIMSVGDFNLTKKGFSKAIKKHSTILVEFTSLGCLKCIRSELEYVKVHEILKEKKIPFARANVDKLKTISLNYGATELPALVLFQKGKPLLYRVRYQT